MSDNTSGDRDQWARLGGPPESARSADSGSGSGDAPEPVADLGWLVGPPPPGREPGRPPRRERDGTRRVSLRGWAALAAVAAVTVGVVAGVHGPQHPATGRGGGGVTASKPVSVGAGVCAGLSGTVVTAGGGDPATVPGVIAAFEDAYYTQRSAEAAVKVVAPESGITEQSLAAGIATIPAGSTHCVAITPVTLNTANVHLVEVHPDRKRVDYLQVVNTVSGPYGGLLISHVQEQG